jgi:hypothetical protein
MALRKHDGLAAAAGLADDLDALHALEQAAQAGPEERVLRGEDEAEHPHGVRRKLLLVGDRSIMDIPAFLKYANLKGMQQSGVS